MMSRELNIALVLMTFVAGALTGNILYGWEHLGAFLIISYCVLMLVLVIVPNIVGLVKDGKEEPDAENDGDDSIQGYII